MARIVQFNTPNGGSSWINPLMVTRLSRTGTGNTMIHLSGDDNGPVVSGEPETVASKLSQGLNEGL